MATTAFEVVPLLAMRRELRIEGNINPDDDARLIGQIGAAVSDVSLDASAPLVDQQETIEAAVPYRVGRLSLPPRSSARSRKCAIGRRAGRCGGRPTG